MELREEGNKINSKIYKERKKEDKKYNRISDLLPGYIYNRLEKNKIK